MNGNGAADPGEGLAGMVLTATDPQGRTVTGFSGRGGAFDLSLNASVAYTVRISGRGYVPVTFGPATIPDLRTRSSIPLTPSPVSVTGTVMYQGSAVTSGAISLRFRGTGNGGVTTDALTDGAGRYVVSLVPGSYQIVVDQNVTPGSAALRWGNAGEDTLGVDVGGAPVTRDLAVLQRGHVTGTVMFSGVPVSTPVTFDGPDSVVVNTTQGAFDTYLALGMYTAYANRTQGAQTYIGVASVSVAGARDVTLTLTLAAQVTGSITINGGSTTEPLTITFNRTQAGTFRALSGTVGTYRIALPAGDYAVTVDEHRTLTVGGIGRAYRIGFSGSLTVAAGATSASFDVAATRDYDNSTVSGRVTYEGVGVPGSITFSQRDTVAMNATATVGPNGTYSVPLLPGEYNVLAASSADPAGAFLGTLKVTQGVDPTLDLALSPAAWVAGVTTYKGGTRVSADITFTASAAAAHATSDPSGNYRILLPLGSYSVTSRMSDAENGMTVYYAKATNVTVAAKMDPFNLPLDRVVRRQVRLTWDASERQTIPPGGVVTYTVFVQNTGNVADSFTFVGSPTAWTFTFSPPQVRLDYGNAGNSTVVDVTIQTPPKALVSHGDVTIAAKSTTDAGIQGSATVQVDIVRRRGLSLSVSSAFPTFDGRDLNYTVTVSNTGNADENVTLAFPGAAQLATRGWVARFAPPSGGGLVAQLDNLSVSGNSTRSVTVVLQSTGGSGGGTATVAVYASDLQSLQATQSLQLVLPQLSGGGRITASGLNVVSDQGLPYPLLAVLITVVACITAAVVLTLRRRRR